MQNMHATLSLVRASLSLTVCIILCTFVPPPVRFSIPLILIVLLLKTLQLRHVVVFMTLLSLYTMISNMYPSVLQPYSLLIGVANVVMVVGLYFLNGLPRYMLMVIGTYGRVLLIVLLGTLIPDRTSFVFLILFILSESTYIVGFYLLMELFFGHKLDTFNALKYPMI